MSSQNCTYNFSTLNICSCEQKSMRKPVFLLFKYGAIVITLIAMATRLSLFPIARCKL